MRNLYTVDDHAVVAWVSLDASVLAHGTRVQRFSHLCTADRIAVRELAAGESGRRGYAVSIWEVFDMLYPVETK